MGLGITNQSCLGVLPSFEIHVQAVGQKSRSSNIKIFLGHTNPPKMLAIQKERSLPSLQIYESWHKPPPAYEQDWEKTK